VTVSKAGTTTTLVVSPATFQVGDQVTLTATVTTLPPSVAPAPTKGKVTFKSAQSADTVNVLGDVTVDASGSGVYSFKYSPPGSGTFDFTAEFSGSNTHADSTSKQAIVVIHNAFASVKNVIGHMVQRKHSTRVTALKRRVVQKTLQARASEDAEESAKEDADEDVFDEI